MGAPLLNRLYAVLRTVWILWQACQEESVAVSLSYPIESVKSPASRTLIGAGCRCCATNRIFTDHSHETECSAS